MSFLHEMGGLADIILKTRVQTTIGNKVYEPGQIVLLQKDVTINFNYERTSAESTSTKTLLEHQIAHPSQIQVSNAALNNQTIDLLFTATDETIVTRTRQVKVMSQDGETLLLPTEAAPNTPLFVYEYDNIYEIVPHVAAQDNEVLGEFETGTYYVVQYEEPVKAKSYSLKVPSYPWFTLEIYFKGNSDKKPSNYMMVFDAVYLTAVPTLNIIQEDIQMASLLFSVIYKAGKEPRFVLLNG